MTSTTPARELAALAAEMTAAQRIEILDAVGICDHYTSVDTPIGPVMVAFNHHGISLLAATSDGEEFRRVFADRFDHRPLKAVSRPPTGLVAALRTGQGRRIDIDLRSLSGFQRQVLDATRDIPVGEVRPYQWIAQRIGRPKAVRAVGTALGRNPVPLVIPCHRVIRGDGATGGYIFGSQNKQSLLEHEGANVVEVAELKNRGVNYVASDTTGVYCDPSCHNARRITDRHKVLIRTATDAEARGFRPCRSCDPVPVVA